MKLFIPFVEQPLQNQSFLEMKFFLIHGTWYRERQLPHDKAGIPTDTSNLHEGHNHFKSFKSSNKRDNFFQAGSVR